MNLQVTEALPENVRGEVGGRGEGIQGSGRGREGRGGERVV